MGRLFKTEADAQKAQAALNKDEDFFSKQLVNGELPETVLKEYNMLQAAESRMEAFCISRTSSPAQPIMPGDHRHRLLCP